MKIIYTQKKSKSDLHKSLMTAFECLILGFVMCFFGMLLARQHLNALDEAYESVDASYNEAVLEAIELVIPIEDESANG